MSTPEHLIEAEVIESVTYDVTRDDLLRTNTWLNARMPMVQKALARRRRAGIVSALIVFATVLGFAVKSGQAKGQPYAVAAHLIVWVGIYLIFMLPVIWYLAIAKSPMMRKIDAGLRQSVKAGDYDHSLGPCTFLITDEMLISDQAWITMRAPWAWCQEAQFAPDAVNLYFDRLGVMCVPLRAFGADAAHRDRFVQAIVDRLPEQTSRAGLAQTGRSGR